MAKKFALIKTFANGNKGVSLVVDKRPKDAFLKALKADGVIEVELFRLERVKRVRVRVVEVPAADEETPQEAEVAQSDTEQVPEVVETEQEATTPAIPAADEETPQEAEVAQSGGKGKGGKRAR